MGLSTDFHLDNPRFVTHFLKKQDLLLMQCIAALKANAAATGMELVIVICIVACVVTATTQHVESFVCAACHLYTLYN